MTNKQKREYQDKIIRELYTKVFTWIGTDTVTIRKEDTMSYWFTGGKTNEGDLTGIFTLEDFKTIEKMIKLELKELKDTLVLNWDEEKGTIEFYLQFTMYQTMYDRMVDREIDIVGNY